MLREGNSWRKSMIALFSALTRPASSIELAICRKQAMRVDAVSAYMHMEFLDVLSESAVLATLC